MGGIEASLSLSLPDHPPGQVPPQDMRVSHPKEMLTPWARAQTPSEDTQPATAGSFLELCVGVTCSGFIILQEGGRKGGPEEGEGERQRSFVFPVRQSKMKRKWGGHLRRARKPDLHLEVPELNN